MLEVLLFSFLSFGFSESTAYAGKGPIIGQTPCCFDRITDRVCTKIKLKNKANFLDKCLNNPDFALIQCCKTCFDNQLDAGYFIDYTLNVENAMKKSEKFCIDRRPERWCQSLVNRIGFWNDPQYRRYHCGNVPFAFRLCRKSCGYCSVSYNQQAMATYDHEVASDPLKCYNPGHGLAYKKVNFTKVFRRFTDRFARYFQLQKDE